MSDIHKLTKLLKMKPFYHKLLCYNYSRSNMHKPWITFDITMGSNDTIILEHSVLQCMKNDCQQHTNASELNVSPL